MLALIVQAFRNGGEDSVEIIDQGVFEFLELFLQSVQLHIKLRVFLLLFLQFLAKRGFYCFFISNDRAEVGLLFFCFEEVGLQDLSYLYMTLLLADFLIELVLQSTYLCFKLSDLLLQFFLDQLHIGDFFGLVLDVVFSID